MTDIEYVKDCGSGCDMAAQDCKGNADYAAYNFKTGNYDEARKYVARLDDCISTLKSQLRCLDSALAKTKSA